MNRIYRLVFNAATGLWTAVAENARGRGKAGRAAYALLAVLAIISPAAYAANAADAKVVGGTGSVATVGNATTINQVSQRLAIDWTQLSTTAGEALNFVQPNAQAIALNRITGSAPSSFLGSLTANGQVFILNPNGILFGAGSQVNVGGIVASTLGMNPTDFMNGSNTFTKTTGTGSVTNQGTMTAAQGGYLALLAPEVRNEGVMTATLGTALLAAGNKVTLSLNNGSLLGYSIDQGAINALAENKQLIKADGGQVLLSAKALDALTIATVNNTGVIEAKTLQNIAGRIMLMGDMQTGTVIVGGTLDASASNGGNGGFIETSAATVNVTDSARVTTLASNGNTGKWLIDPNDFTIAASGGNMTGAAVTTALAGGNFEIQTTTMGTAGGNGDIFVKDFFSWTANTLTLNAERNINVSQVMLGSGAAKLALKYGQGAPAAGNTANYFFTSQGRASLPAGPNFSTQLGSDGAVINYQVITSLGAPGSTTGADLQGMNGNLSGNYALGSPIDASATASWNSGLGFAPIATNGAFVGRFDGLGNSINALTINRPGTSLTGLFSRLNANASVSNIRLTNVAISGNSYTGGLVGTLIDGSVRNSSVESGAVAGAGDQVGGLIGYASPNSIASITDSSSAASVSGISNVGGLVGEATFRTTIRNSFATGSVLVNSAGVNGGGLVGRFGGASLSTLSNSYATGNVSGLPGASALGGLIGYNDATVTGSFATGNVSANALSGSGGFSVGGLAGFNASSGNITNNYAIGSVTGQGNVGGLVGLNVNTGSVSNSYASGTVASVSAIGVGGLVGAGAGPVTSSYWNIQTSGQSSSARGTGITSAQSQQLATFAGWDMDAQGGTGKVWRIYQGNTAPQLRSFLTPLAATGSSTTSYNAATQSGPTVSAGGVAGAAASGRNVGTYQDTYYSSAPNKSGVDITGSTLAITPANLVLSTSNVSKTYDSGLSALGSVLTVGGTLLLGSDTLSGGSFAFTDKNAGIGNKAVAVSGVTVNDGNGGSNYNISYANNTTSTINKAPLLVTAAGVDRSYDGTTAATVTYGDNRLGTDALTVSGSASFVTKNVASGIAINVTGIALGGADAGNYSANTTASTSARITPKALLVTAKNDSKDFGGAAYSGGNGVQFNGFAASETAANLSGILRYGGTSQGATASGSYSIAPSGLSSSNYSISFADGTLTIRPADAATTAVGGPTLSAAYKSTLDSLARLNFSNVKFGISDDDRAVLEALNAAAEEE